MKVNLVYFLSVFAFFISTASNAAPVAPSISAISELAKALINEKISVPANAKVEILPQTIDNRLLPSQCSSPIHVELASEREISRNNTIKVSCDTPDLSYPWQIFMSVRVDILFPVVVDRKSVV